MTAAALIVVWSLKILYIAEGGLMGRPPKDGRDVPAPEWSMTQYGVQIMAHLTGAGEPMACHLAMKILLIFWLAFATLIACENMEHE